MIDTIIQIVMSTVLICGCIAIGISLIHMHRDKNSPNLSDLITSTDKQKKVRLDPRKCFEAGAFLSSTWAFIFLTSSGRLTEFFFVGYMGVWTAARSMRDREQRLTLQGKQ